MDPTATWILLNDTLQALEKHPADASIRESAVELLEALADWLRRGGFPPTVENTERTRDE